MEGNMALIDLLIDSLKREAILQDEKSARLRREKVDPLINRLKMGR